MARTKDVDVHQREDFVKTVAECVTDASKFSEIFLNHKLFDLY